MSTNNITFKPLTNMEISTFCDQMAMILKSGISTIEGISIMSEDMADSSGKALLNKIYEDLEASGNLSQAMDISGVFPDYVLNMVNIGEQSGRLDEVMASLALHYQREENLSGSIKNAVTYPLIMIGMMIIVIAVLIVKVLPIFNQVFIQLGSEMTGFSRGLLNMGAVISRYSIVFIAIVCLLVVLLVYLSKSKKGRAFMVRFTIKFFATKDLREKIAVSRFASGMALTLKSGLDTDQSLDMIESLVGHPGLQSKIRQCRELTSEGMNFPDALAKSKIFTGIYAKMISIGFKSGVMDEVMSKAADQFDDEIQTRVSRMVSIIEPTLVAVLSIIIGLILLSVMLPLMGIMSNIG